MPIFPSFHWHHSSQIRSVANDLDLIITGSGGVEESELVAKTGNGLFKWGSVLA